MKLASVVYFLFLFSLNLSVNCQRSRNAVSKSPNCLGLLSTLSTANEVDGKFILQLELGSKIYEPFEKYSVILRSNDINTHFKEFNIIAESEEKNSKVSVGRFERYKEALTKYSDDCPNGVTQSSLIPKQEIKVKWIAPPSGSGCIRFRAAARGNLEQWITNSNSMSFVVCEENQLLDGQPKILQRCTACDEAKYGVEIVGLWSRNTHPVDYPKNAWDSAFSSFIGASHSNDFRIFSIDELASEPLRRMAEDGESKYLVQMMNGREKKRQIRTVIKARGITHPLMNGKTFAEFRVDKDCHLMSLVAKLMPSPDWFIGVDSLELCSKNGSWINEKQMNLYLYDAGTDGGSGYENANKFPLKFHEKIYQLTNLHPENSPFYNLNESKIKPFARIKVVKQKVFPSKGKCNLVEAFEEEDDIDDSLERSFVYGETVKNVSPTESRPNYWEDNQPDTDNNYSEETNENNNDNEANRKKDDELSNCILGEWDRWGECVINQNENQKSDCGTGKAKKYRKLLSGDPILCAKRHVLDDEGDCTKDCRTGRISYQIGDREIHYAGEREDDAKDDFYAAKDENRVNVKDSEDETMPDPNESIENYNEKMNPENVLNENEVDEIDRLNRYGSRDPIGQTSGRPYFEEDAFSKPIPSYCQAYLTEWSDFSSCFGNCPDRYKNRTRELTTFDPECMRLPLILQVPCDCPRSGRQRMNYRGSVTPRMIRPKMNFNKNVRSISNSKTQSNTRNNVKFEKRTVNKSVRTANQKNSRNMNAELSVRGKRDDTIKLNK